MNEPPLRFQSSSVASPPLLVPFLTLFLLVQMTEYITAMPEGSTGVTFPLTNIKLHSPSAIIGTPLDPTSRFEYPFPSPQLEHEFKNTTPHIPHAPHSSNFLSVGSTSSARQRQSYVHPKHEVREVPVPPTLDKKVNIDLRFPRPMEGGNALGQAPASIKRRKGIDVILKES